MHTKTMEGLIGARTNMNMTKIPMGVFKEARRRGDTATMERAMGYVNDFENKAYAYKDKADEGMKEEAEEAREKEKQELEQTLEERRKERKELEAQTDNVENVQVTGKNNDMQDNADTTVQGTDTVEISPQGQELWNQSSNAVHSETFDSQPKQPVFYSSAGSCAKNISQNDISTVNVTI